MAFAADTNWEYHPTGNDFNGGGFAASFGGTDYTQQDAAQLTVTDAVVNASSTTLTSATGGFTSQMVGNCIGLVDTGTFLGPFQIAAFTNANTVTIDRIIDGANHSGMSCRVGGARTIGQGGFGVAMIAGNKGWLKGSAAFTPSVNQPTMSASGTAAAPITLEGYTTTRGDGGRATINSAAGFGALSISGSHVIVKNIVADSFATSSAYDALTVSGNFNQFRNCIGRAGTARATNITGNYSYFKDCVFDGKGTSTDALLVQGTGNLIEFSDAVNSGATGAGINLTTGGHEIINCIVRNNSLDGIIYNAAANNGVTIRQCDLWNNGRDGFRIASTAGGLQDIQVEACIIGRNVGYDINYAPSDVSAQQGAKEWAKIAFDSNAFYTGGTGRYFQLPAGTGDVVLTVNPFVDDVTTLDFRLNSIAGGGLLLQQNLWQQTFADGQNVSKHPYGALGSNVAAASGVTAGTAPVIDEIQFPTDISENAIGGPTFATVVVEAGNGTEQRVPLMTLGRYRWNIAPGLKTPTQANTLISFWLLRKGRARGFRFKDWFDYTTTNEPLTLTGVPTTQLIKTYSDGLLSYVRNIYKPQQNLVSVTINRNGSPYVAWTLDATTGLVTWSPLIQKAISGITQASSAVVTVPLGHGFVVNDVVYFASVTGMTQINTLTGTVTATTTTTITVNINSTGFSAYTSGGTVSKYPQPTDNVNWSGQFDVPCRFDMDDMQLAAAGGQTRQWDNLPVVEIRGSS